MFPLIAGSFVKTYRKWKIVLICFLAALAFLLPSTAFVAQAKPLSGATTTNLLWAGISAQFPASQYSMIAKWQVACPTHGQSGVLSSLIQAVLMGGDVSSAAMAGTDITDVTQTAGSLAVEHTQVTAFIRNGGVQVNVPPADSVACGDMMQGIVSQGDFMLIRNLTRNWTFSQTYGPVANQAHVSCLLGRDDGTDLMNFNLVSFDTCSAFDRLTGNTEGIGDCPSNPSLARDCSNWHFVMMQRPLPPNTIFPDIMATFFGPPDFGRVGVITNGEFDMVWRSPN